MRDIGSGGQDLYRTLKNLGVLTRSAKKDCFCENRSIEVGKQGLGKESREFLRGLDTESEEKHLGIRSESLL